MTIRGGGAAQSVSTGAGSVPAITVDTGIPENDREMLARIERLEKQQKADAATWKRLNSDQQEVERKVDKVQDGMDSLADSCNRVDRPNNRSASTVSTN